MSRLKCDHTLDAQNMARYDFTTDKDTSIFVTYRQGEPTSPNRWLVTAGSLGKSFDQSPQASRSMNAANEDMSLLVEETEVMVDDWVPCGLGLCPTSLNHNSCGPSAVSLHWQEEGDRRHTLFHRECALIARQQSSKAASQTATAPDI
jgi:hypothetical protein